MYSALGKTILVVDDSADMQTLLKTLLESKGFTIQCTSNGIEALSLLKEANPLPDLILMDMQMPEMDGHTLKMHLKEHPHFKSIPVIIMTGEEEAESPVEKTENFVILRKPFNIKTILGAVENNFSKPA